MRERLPLKDEMWHEIVLAAVQGAAHGEFTMNHVAKNAAELADALLKQHESRFGSVQGSNPDFK